MYGFAKALTVKQGHRPIARLTLRGPTEPLPSSPAPRKERGGVATHDMADVVQPTRDRRIADEKWKVVVSGLFMFFCALVVISFFSSTFEFGDNVIRYFLSATTGGNWWRPCE